MWIEIIFRNNNIERIFSEKLWRGVVKAFYLVPTQNSKIRTTESSEKNYLVITDFLKQASEASRIYNIYLFRH